MAGCIVTLPTQRFRRMAYPFHACWFLCGKSGRTGASGAGRLPPMPVCPFHVYSHAFSCGAARTFPSRSRPRHHSDFHSGFAPCNPRRHRWSSSCTTRARTACPPPSATPAATCQSRRRTGPTWSTRATPPPATTRARCVAAVQWRRAQAEPKSRNTGHGKVRGVRRA